MLRKAIVLNGPPGSGKDTIANMLEPMGFKHRAFKDTLYIATLAHFGVVSRDARVNAMLWMKDRALKESNDCPYFNGLSPREALIYVSEKVIKPNYGDDYFGVQAFRACGLDNDKETVFSDGGFGSEILPLLEHFSSVLVVRLRREGYSFEGDSRRYIAALSMSSRVYILDEYLEDNKPEKAVRNILKFYETIGY